MQILIGIEPSPGGRLTGTIGVQGSDDVATFSGNFELLAHIEDLCRRGANPGSDDSHPTDQRSL
jgi:hypothetical protein